MNDYPEIMVGVFPYRDPADHDFAERVTDELSAAGVDTDHVHIFVPPFARPENAGNAGAGVHNAIQALGVDRDTAIWCEREFRDGHILVLVRPGTLHQEVQTIFARHGTRATHPTNAMSSAGAPRSSDRQSDSPLLRDRSDSARRGRGIEPDVTETDEPLVHDYERGQHRIR